MQKGDEIDHKKKKVDGSQEQQQQQQTSFKDLAHKCSRSKIQNLKKEILTHSSGQSQSVSLGFHNSIPQRLKNVLVCEFLPLCRHVD